MKNPKAKGGKFERECCVALSLWVTHGQRQDVFWRSAMSGGRATVRGNVRRKLGVKHFDIRQGGDICAVAPEGNKFCEDYYIECKHLKSLDVHGLLHDPPSGQLFKWWTDTQRKAARSQRSPILIARQNRQPTLFCIDVFEWGHPPVLTVPKHKLHIHRFDDILKLRYEPL